MVKVIQPRARLTETQPGSAFEATAAASAPVTNVAAGVTGTVQLDHDFVTEIDARYSQGNRNVLAMALVGFEEQPFDQFVEPASNYRSWVAMSLKITEGGVPSTVQIGGAQSINLDRDALAGAFPSRAGNDRCISIYMGGVLTLVDGNEYIITGVRADMSFLAEFADQVLQSMGMTEVRIGTGISEMVNI